MENEEIIGETNFLHFEMPLSRNQKACISGFAYNEFDGILYLMIVDDIDFSYEVPTLLLADAERLYKRARNFFLHSEEISKYGEESNEAVNLAKSIYTRKKNDQNQFYELTSVKVFTMLRISPARLPSSSLESYATRTVENSPLAMARAACSSSVTG